MAHLDPGRKGGCIRQGRACGAARMSWASLVPTPAVWPSPRQSNSRRFIDATPPRSVFCPFCALILVLRGSSSELCRVSRLDVHVAITCRGEHIRRVSVSLTVPHSWPLDAPSAERRSRHTGDGGRRILAHPVRRSLRPRSLRGLIRAADTRSRPAHGARRTLHLAADWRAVICQPRWRPSPGRRRLSPANDNLHPAAVARSALADS